MGVGDDGVNETGGGILLCAFLAGGDETNEGTNMVPCRLLEVDGQVEGSSLRGFSAH